MRMLKALRINHPPAIVSAIVLAVAVIVASPAKAIVTPPRLLLIDEFSLGLAPTVIAEVLPVIRRIAARGAAVLLVEQSVNVALSVSDHAYVMEKGEIGYSGPAGELRARPDLLRAAYLEGLAHALHIDRREA